MTICARRIFKAFLHGDCAAALTETFEWSARCVQPFSSPRLTETMCFMVFAAEEEHSSTRPEEAQVVEEHRSEPHH